MPWEDLKPIFRPETVHMGVMEVDADKCNQCGLCVENCLLDAWEMDENEVARFKDGHKCMSCFQCMVPCPTDAISIVEIYHVDKGFYATDPQPLPVRLPMEPRDAEGNADRWNAIEEEVLTRRSVRNYLDKPVPETLIRRVLEAGRFAPSAGNCQPWKFIVVTDRAFIEEMAQAIRDVLNGLHSAYIDDEGVKSLVAMYEANPNPGLYDPRIIQGGLAAAVEGILPIFLNAPAVILMACDDRAIGGPDTAIGICGQNMNLVANSLGVKSCWVGFSRMIESIPSLKEKLGLEDPWKINSALVLGYPKFKQMGAVPREFRPITWFREGADSPEIEE